jgi:hypothetical protein
LKLRQACNHLSLVKDLSTDDVFDDKDDVALELSMFKLDLTDTLNDKNIQALTKDTELQYDMTFLSTKLDCLLKKLDFIVNQQGEKCKKQKLFSFPGCKHAIGLTGGILSKFIF